MRVCFVALCLLGACYSPTVPGRCTIACSATAPCPSDFQCENNVCNSVGADPCAADGPPPPPGGCLIEEFTDSPIDTVTRWNANFVDATSALAAEGEFAITFSGSASLDRRAILESQATYDFTDGTIQADFDQPIERGIGDGITTLAITDPSGSSMSMTIVGKQLQYGKSGSNAPYDRWQHRHVRIRHIAAADQFVFETSFDGKSFFELPGAASASNFDVTAVKVSFGVATSSGFSVSTQAIIDNVVLGVPGCPVRDYGSTIADQFFNGDTNPVALQTHDADVGGGGTWTNVGGADANIQTDDVVAPVIQAQPATSAYTNPTILSSASYDVEADVRFFDGNDGTQVGTLLGRVGGNGAYAFVLTSSGGSVVPRLGEYRTLEATLLVPLEQTTKPCSNLTRPRDVSSEHHIRLRIRGTTISGWFDGEKVCEGTDATISAAGLAGLRVDGAYDPASSGTSLDNFVVRDATN